MGRQTECKTFYGSIQITKEGKTFVEHVSKYPGTLQIFIYVFMLFLFFTTSHYIKIQHLFENKLFSMPAVIRNSIYRKWKKLPHAALLTNLNVDSQYNAHHSKSAFLYVIFVQVMKFLNLSLERH